MVSSGVRAYQHFFLGMANALVLVLFLFAVGLICGFLADHFREPVLAVLTAVGGASVTLTGLGQLWPTVLGFLHQPVTPGQSGLRGRGVDPVGRDRLDRPATVALDEGDPMTSSPQDEAGPQSGRGAVDGMLAQLKQLGELKSQGALTGRRVRAADEPDPRLLRCGPLGVRSARP